MGVEIVKSGLTFLTPISVGSDYIERVAKVQQIVIVNSLVHIAYRVSRRVLLFSNVYM